MTSIGASGELAEILALEAAHGREQLLAALRRAVAFGRWWATDVRSILAAGTGVAHPTTPGEALVLTLPVTASRPLTDYGLDTFTRTAVELGTGDAS